MKKAVTRAIYFATLFVACSTVLRAATVDPASAPITLGRWHADVWKAKAYSEANDIPLLYVWGSQACAYCDKLDTYIQTGTFTTWQANRKLVMAYVKAPDSTITAEVNFARYGFNATLSDFPLVAVYWKSKNVEPYCFTGRYSGGSTDDKARAFINEVQIHISDYVSTPPKELQSIEIIGQDNIYDGLDYQYDCIAHFDDGSSSSIQSSASWSEEVAFAEVSGSGNLSVSDLDSDQSFVLNASYTYNGTTKTDTLNVQIQNYVINGSGTELDPYLINSKNDLLYMAADLADYDKYYLLNVDIDLTGEEFTKAVIAPNSQTGSTFAGTPFSGIFDGNGHVIRNINITSAVSDYWLGLFGKVAASGIISKLGIENISIADTGNNSRYVGSVCGQNGGIISECYVADCDIQANAYAGGLCGLNSYGGSVSKCYVYGQLTGADKLGGACGYNYQGSRLENCYASCSISSTGDKGGFCAGNDDTSVVVSCFWNQELSGVATSEGATPKTDEEMKTESTFTGAGWDFATIWIMDEYPALICFENAAPPIDVPYSGGAGSLDNPYLVSSVEDLLCLSTNTADYDKVFRLMDDIDLSGVVFDKAVIAPDNDNTNDEFDGPLFAGVFDGNGHKIQNLIIDSSGSNNDFLALVGGNEGEVRNLGVVNALIDAGADSENIGVVCAFNSCGQISKCYTEGVINGGSIAGGFCGFNQSDISESYSDVSVSGTSVLAGFCAQNFCGNISNCYSLGAVSGQLRVAGFCTENAGVLNNCYSIGEVNAPWDVSGFCYTNSIEEGCGMCGIGDANNHDGVISNCFWDIETSGDDSSCEGALGKTTEEMTVQSTFADAGWSFASMWYMNAYPELQAYYKEYSGGSGTLADPYQIGTKRELMNMATNTALYSKSFMLIDDIDLQGEVFSRAVIAPDNGDASNYDGTAFSGVFNGNGFEIQNLTIAVSANSSWLGFFGKLDGAQVFDLGINGVSIIGDDASKYIGGLCGQVSGASVSRCYVDMADLQTGSYVGGFCGLNSYNGVIDNCYAIGDVAGSANIGGFCGYNYQSSMISNSYTASSVAATGVNGAFSSGSDASSTYVACFWDSDVAGVATSDGGTGKTEVEMKTESTFTSVGWNFVDLWSMSGYPRFISGYQLIVDQGSGDGNYITADIIHLVADAAQEGDMFSHWTVSPAEFVVNIQGDIRSPEVDFEMPDEDVTVTANYLTRPHVVPHYSGVYTNEWTMDYNAALAHAETNGMNTILMFAGSWWCGDCEDLEAHVLTNQVWLSYLESKPVMMVMLDFDVRPAYWQYFPIGHPENRCFLRDEKYLSDNGLTAQEGEDRLAFNYTLQEQYCLPSSLAENGYAKIPFPSFIVLRPDGSRAGRMNLEGDPDVQDVIRWVDQALASDPADEMDDEVPMIPTVLNIPADKTVSQVTTASVSEVDLADNFSFNAVPGESYIFNIGPNAQYDGVPLYLTLIQPDGSNIVESAVVDSSQESSTVFDGLGDATYFLRISPQNSQSNLVGYTLSVQRDYKYNGGAGTEMAPYLIGNKDEFLNFAGNTDDYGKVFELTADIDLSGEVFPKAVIASNITEGTIFTGVSFSGVFNGNGYVIRNVTIQNQGYTDNYLGLFGKVENARIFRLGAENITISDISNSSSFIGGFCGQNSGSDIYECYVKGATISGYRYIGGFCGLNSYGGSVSDCFAVDGSVTAVNNNSAGFCGYNYNEAILESCYAAIPVNVGPDGVAGGFCSGQDSTSCTMCTCFWDSDVAGAVSAVEGNPKTTSEMKTMTPFVDAQWSFPDVWYINGGYPLLTSFTPLNSFQRWLAENGVAVDRLGQGDSASLDGLSNLLKYATGLDALSVFSTSDIMNMAENPSPDMFEVIFYKSKSAVNVTLEPVYATSLNGPWDSGVMTVTSMGEEGDREVFKASVPKSGQGFVRLRATLNP